MKVMVLTLTDLPLDGSNVDDCEEQATYYITGLVSDTS